eukprot:1148233-Pelagomonas_calceolata.AAC.1
MEEGRASVMDGWHLHVVGKASVAGVAGVDSTCAWQARQVWMVPACGRQNSVAGEVGVDGICAWQASVAGVAGSVAGEVGVDGTCVWQASVAGVAGVDGTCAWQAKQCS